MNELRRNNMNPLVPRETLVRQGMTGIGSTAAGLGLLLLRGLTQFGAGFSIPGLVVGGVLAVTGMKVSTGKKADRVGGLVMTGSGVLTAIASLPVVGTLGSGLMWLGGVGLLGAGVFNVFRFIRGVRSRR
ncbi:MAG: hypothetical protein ACQETQ_11360 [Spirochaetota bacterium]